MLHVEDVRKNACKQHYPLTAEKYAFVITNYNIMADEDPTGNLPVWVEQLLDQCEDDNHIDFVENQVDQVYESLISEYRVNEVSGGEFLDGHKVPKELNGSLVSFIVVSKAIEKFREWDGTDWFFAIKDNGNEWEIFNINSVKFDGKEYPVRTLEVKNEDENIHGTYVIAPESLLDELEKYRDDEDYYIDNCDECESIDELIYHYVEDDFFYNDAKHIAKHNLDMPFDLIQEIPDW